MTYVYVLVSSPKDLYYEQALMSLYSLRLYMPDARTVVLVDSGTKATFTEENKRTKLASFASEIISVDFDDKVSNVERSRLIKTSIPDYVDNDFLYIDCDTIIAGDLSEIENCPFETAGILHKAGVKVAITTDHPVSLIQTLPICAGFCVKAGLTVDEALRAITIHAAQICGVADRVGSLEIGKDADIAVFDGNPLEVSAKTYCTLIDGNVVYQQEEK